MSPTKRCSWPQTDLDIEYHDTEWGVPVHDDRRLFELLTLEGAQAGLSWSIVLRKQREFGSFDAYVWQFVGGSPRTEKRRSLSGVPARTAESDALSKDLKRRGFTFVGSTICYAFMQAVRMVNDHVVTCFRYNEVRSLGAR